MELAKEMGNVFLAEWIPQIKLLSKIISDAFLTIKKLFIPKYFSSDHPRLRLFISHSGYNNSLMEAARAGIPILTIPFFGDQHRNARVPERNGWGICFGKGKLLEGSEEFENILEKILENPE
jgi:UDP:flavonoid glycosyltransferase YjiC (YdhE family)